MRRSDFVSINCPLDDTTRNMISTRQFGLMQKHAYFITAARGFITDEKALEEALRNKQIAGAGLDVFSKEPPAMDHPLLQFDNVIASPHTAGVTKEARANMGKFAAEQLILTLDGRQAAAHGQSRSVAGLCQALRTHLRHSPGGLAAMISKFHVLYVGQIELDNIGLNGTPANDRRYSDERLREVFATVKDVAQTWTSSTSTCSGWPSITSSARATRSSRT